MFDRILIANRGEIACRVMRTARRLGVECVAVYSEADAAALHVRLAEVAVPIGGPRPQDSYLRGDVIIKAALDTGAQAIHPGYGFLSENPEFVDAVTAAGLIFIGPSASAIRAMGLKDAAKKLMEQAGVPVVPGYHGADQDDALLRQHASGIGYPVLIKAVAGGGGKGMRMVEADAEFDAALKSARGEAATAFGNDAVLIEKFVTAPRHIEVQVFGDGKDAVHLFERDCSLQRRHQKVIEEAPAPGMTAEMRHAMGDAAVRAAKAIGYSGAGTVEFIVDGSDGLRPDRFWFMEMNTRLQVEHPVTEAVTGVDLVEWQLRVAAGGDLPARQEDLRITGHSFEARLYAEDVPAGFLPATGRLDHLEFPQDARADSGVVTGDVISPFYDPMIAKVIVHDTDRTAALRRMERALAGTQVTGLTTNLAFLRALLRHEGFAAGRVDTGLIARHIEALTAAAPPTRQAVALAAGQAAGLLDVGAATDPRAGQGFTLWAPLCWRVTLQHAGDHAGEPTEVTLYPHAHGFAAEWDGSDGRVEMLRQPDGGWVCGPERLRADLRTDVVQGRKRITVFGLESWRFDVIDPLTRATESGPAGNLVEAPMPGLVKSLSVAPGDTVTAGDPLAVLEAMKMEHTLRAPRDGLVAEVLAAAGDQVEAGAALIRLADDEEDAPA